MEGTAIFTGLLPRQEKCKVLAECLVQTKGSTIGRVVTRTPCQP